jgi:hypothetical protein
VDNTIYINGSGSVPGTDKSTGKKESPPGGIVIRGAAAVKRPVAGHIFRITQSAGGAIGNSHAMDGNSVDNAEI